MYNLIKQKIYFVKLRILINQVYVTWQVYPQSWSAIYVSLDNKGMWNLRSAIWERRYLGQELYLRVSNDERSFFTETDVPPNALFCGKAKRPQ